ncbi:hypothetical protein [Embleya hyalina]|uniref:Uncharacterized protein n=1 Tax=Embleya hyalina TaxID=516124 RepID=A0A401Z3Z5_9ACTN|nr:hypothetical protein [Embleya hyalina]GCE01572.1 hypothetical protein EHYA_09338 [Embleya hyalina]
MSRTTTTTATRPGRITYVGRDRRIRALLPRVIAAVRAQDLVLPDTVISTAIGPANVDRAMLTAMRRATDCHDPKDNELDPAPIGPWPADRAAGAVTTPAWRGNAEIVLDRDIVGRTPEDDLIRLLGHHLVHAAQLHAASPVWIAVASHHTGIRKLAPQWLSRRRDQLAADERAAHTLAPTILAAVRHRLPTLF